MGSNVYSEAVKHVRRIKAMKVKIIDFASKQHEPHIVVVTK